MGKGRQKFNKKQAVRFTLVPAFDSNGKPITHFRPVETKKSQVNASQRQKIIRQISDEVYDEIEINGRLVGQDQIPAFVLQQIRGKKDLVYNQKQMNQSHGLNQHEGDLYEVVDAKDYDNEEFGEEDEQLIDEQDIIDEEEYQEQDDEEDFMQNEEGSWEDDEEEYDEVDEDKSRNNKPFVLDVHEFPTLNKVNIEGKQYELTEAQIKLLDVLIPQNYENFQIKGLKFQKYDEMGLPLSQKEKYQHFIASGNEGIVDSYQYVPPTPTNIYDTDLKPSQLKGDLRQLQDALNFDGQEGAYQEIEDDFFAKLIQSEIQINKNQKSKVSESKKSQVKQVKQQKKAKNAVSKAIKPKPQQIQKIKLPVQLQNQKQKESNLFAKYDELDEDILQEQITDEMLDKALDDFQHNLEPKQQVKIKTSKGEFNKHKVDEQMEELQQGHTPNNQSMNFSEIQKCEQFFGKDGELDWRCLTRKEKKQYMKTKIIREFYDEIREREIEEKLKGKKNITAEQLHLKCMIKHLSFEEDHVMRRALEEDAKREVNLDQPSDHSSETESDDENILQYHQRTSVISSNLNQIAEPSNRKPKKKKLDDEQRQKELNELNQTLSKLKSASEKRNRNETKEERKARKEKQKQVKKQRKEIKKQFAQKFAQERRKHLKMEKPSDPLHKISYVKIV